MNILTMNKVKELNCAHYKNVYELLNKNIIAGIRKECEGNSLIAAKIVSKIFRDNGFLAEVLTFKNGGSLKKSGVLINDTLKPYHAVVLMGEWAIDILESDEIIKTKDYIERLKLSNHELRVDYILSSGWYRDNGIPYMPTLDDLCEYRF